MKKTLTILVIMLIAASSAQAALTKPSYCKVAITGKKDPLILKLDQYPIGQLASYKIKEYSFKNLVISEIVFKQILSSTQIN